MSLDRHQKRTGWPTSAQRSPKRARAIDPARDSPPSLHEATGNQAAIRLFGGARESSGGRAGLDAHRLARLGTSGPSERLPFFEQVQAAFGPEHDLSTVRAHVGPSAVQASRTLAASAYAYGDDVAFGKAPTLEDAAHEAAHVVQQRHGDVGSASNGGFGDDAHERDADQVAARVVRGESAAPAVPHGATARPGSTESRQPVTGSKALQRRLLATESTAGAVDRFRALAEPASGMKLRWDPATRRVEDIASLAAGPMSPTFEVVLQSIIPDTTADAEVNFGTHQATMAGGGVVVGQFPVPPELTGSRVQLVDMNDVESIEASTPGHGVALLAHELWENYQAHHIVSIMAGNAFLPAHEDAVTIEGQVLGDLVGPGHRVAEVYVNTAAGQTLVFDYESYYLLFDASAVAPVSPTDIDVSNSRIKTKLPVSSRTIDNFTSNGHAMPSAAATTLTAVRGDLAAHPFATVRIEGFTDDVGSALDNEQLGGRRAAATLTALGISDDERVNLVARGAVTFAVPNDSPAHRAQNRRVLITVTEPGP